MSVYDYFAPFLKKVFFVSVICESSSKPLCGYLQLETLINIYSALLVLGIFFLIAVQMPQEFEKYISFIFARTDVWFCMISFRGSVYITFYRPK